MVGLVLVAGLGACSPGTETALPSPEEVEAYVAEVEDWRAGRLERLTSETGWLTLVGLHWLQDGPNRVGSGADADLPLPADRAPEWAGTLYPPESPGGSLRFELAPGAGVAIEGEEITGPVELATDGQGEATVLELGSLTFYVIARGERLGLRVKDSQSPARLEFAGIESYPVDPAWRLTARFEPYDPPRELAILDVTGGTQPSVSPGAVIFEKDGRSFRLDALDAGDELFLIVHDQTSGHGTYGAGRYLYTPVASEDGTVELDFNKLYNPPCAFTEFATCPLPPAQNRLDLAIEAGEKDAGHH
jgi:uncharacterized protein (DUF1684 family)